MTEYTQQGEQQGTTQQGAPSQPQAAQPGQSQQLQREQGPDNSGQQYANERGSYPNEPQYQNEPRGSQEDAIKAAVDKALAERDAQHARETAKLRNQVPQLVVPAHGGGPGNDNHQPSWNLAEQEAAARGEHLDYWDVDE